jgi:hypothetical protein
MNSFMILAHRSMGGAYQQQRNQQRLAEGRRRVVHEAIPSLPPAFSNATLMQYCHPELPC